MRYTSAYGSLLWGLNEVRIIESHAKSLERKNAVLNADRVNAMTRGGVVLLSSHLEAYVKALVELTLTRSFSKDLSIDKFPKKVLYFGSQDLIRELKEASDPEKVAEKTLTLFARDGANWIASGPLPQAISWEIFEAGFASPKVKNIAKFIGRVGYADLKRDLAKRQAGRYVFVTNAIDHLVDVRNAIAHGDQNEKKTPSELGDLTDFTKEFCRDLDSLYGDWCKTNLCPIR